MKCRSCVPCRAACLITSEVTRFDSAGAGGRFELRLLWSPQILMKKCYHYTGEGHQFTCNLGRELTLHPSQRSFSRKGFQQNISSSHMVAPPLCFPLLVPATTAQRLHSGSDVLEGAFPSRGGWSIVIMTSTCQVGHNHRKVPHEHMSRGLTCHHPAHFLISWSPCSKDRAGPEEGGGGGGWLAPNVHACHPRLGSFIVQEVIGGGAQRPFGCGLYSE